MEIIQAIFIIVVVLAVMGILYNAARVYQKLYTVTYQSIKNPIWRAIKSAFRALIFVFVHHDGGSYPYDG